MGAWDSLTVLGCGFVGWVEPRASPTIECVVGLARGSTHPTMFWIGSRENISKSPSRPRNSPDHPAVGHDHAADEDGGLAGLGRGLVAFLVDDADRSEGAVGDLPVGRVGQAVAVADSPGDLLVDLAELVGVLGQVVLASGLGRELGEGVRRRSRARSRIPEYAREGQGSWPGRSLFVRLFRRLALSSPSVRARTARRPDSSLSSLSASATAS